MSDDGYYEDRSYIYNYIGHDDGLPPHYADPIHYDVDVDRPSGRRETRREREGRQADDVPARGLVGAKAVFAVIVFTALATMVYNPGLLIYTLPLSTLLVTALAMAGGGRRKRKEVRKIRPCSET